LLQTLGPVAALQQRPFAVVGQALQLLFGRNVQVNQDAARFHAFTVLAAEHRAAAGGNYHTVFAQNLCQRFGFTLPKAGFTFQIENGGDRRAGLLFDIGIKIHKTQAKLARQPFAMAGFSGTHRPDENKWRTGIHGSMLPLPLGFRNGQAMRLDVVIIGAGDLGVRLARQRVQAGDRVWCMRRRELPMPEGVHAAYGDLFVKGSYAPIPKHPDWLVYAVSPDERNEASYRRWYVEGQAFAQQCLQPKHTLFVSSTAVYAQNSGEWVDADSPANALTFNGRTLREAEQLCLQTPSNQVLRLSGLCGPGRHQLQRKALLGEGIANVWSNRIHIADAASAASHVLSQPGARTIWLANDDQPALQLDVVNWIRAQNGLPALPPFVDPPSGRRVSNAQLKASGWQPQYRSFREIYTF
jgi:nucleoside-diphosphate-sugar epimerase